MTDKEKETVRLLRQDGAGYGTIAREIGISVETVKSFCRRHRLRAGEMSEEKSPTALSNGTTLCENCGAEVRQNPGRKRKRFCCDKCRNEWWNRHKYMVNRKAIYEFECQNCGRKFYAYGDRSRKYCCHECYVQDRFGDAERHIESGGQA